MRETRTAQTSLFDVYAQHKFGGFLSELFPLHVESHQAAWVLQEKGSDLWTGTSYPSCSRCC